MYNVVETAEELARELDQIELDVIGTYRLSDAIREGSKRTVKAHGWGDGQNSACALSAAFIAAKSRGYLL